jgi:Protein of unknown function (DUF2934)
MLIRTRLLTLLARIIQVGAAVQCNRMEACMNEPAINIKIDDDEAKRRLIAEVAYFAAERRGFTPGYELDDWLEAEQEVESSIEAIGP